MALPEHLEAAEELSARLIESADRGEASCSKEGCLVLFGLMRDSGFKMLAEIRRCELGHGGPGHRTGSEGVGGTQGLVLLDGTRRTR